MKVLLANPRGFCAGVERAIEIVEKSIQKYGAPVYVRHEIVHNKFVVDDLKKKGAVFVEELEEIKDKSNNTLLAKVLKVKSSCSFIPLINKAHLPLDHTNAILLKLLAVNPASVKVISLEALSNLPLIEPLLESCISTLLVVVLSDNEIILS